MKADDIRPRREALGISQAELAVAAGVHPATVQRLEAGRAQRPNPRTLAAIEAALRRAALEVKRCGLPHISGAQEGNIKCCNCGQPMQPDSLWEPFGDDAGHATIADCIAAAIASKDQEIRRLKRERDEAREMVEKAFNEALTTASRCSGFMPRNAWQASAAKYALDAARSVNP